MSSLSREAIFGVLSGLTLLGCDKDVPAKPEPSAAVSPAASAGVTAKEVPSAVGSAAEKAGSCAPGGCAPGKCGGGEKK